MRSDNRTRDRASPKAPHAVAVHPAEANPDIHGEMQHYLQIESIALTVVDYRHTAVKRALAEQFRESSCQRQSARLW